ncbi:MAG: hypothetical protein ACRYFZ_07335 [Janthinobacterium lividum]
MPTVAFITPEEHEAAIRELRTEFRDMLCAYVTEHEQWLPTERAMKAAGIKARSTLVQFARASRPDTEEPGHITYKKDGTKCLYARASCINYARNKRGLPALAA